MHVVRIWVQDAQVTQKKRYIHAPLFIFVHVTSRVLALLYSPLGNIHFFPPIPPLPFPVLQLYRRVGPFPGGIQVIGAGGRGGCAGQKYVYEDSYSSHHGKRTLNNEQLPGNVAKSVRAGRGRWKTKGLPRSQQRQTFLSIVLVQ